MSRKPDQILWWRNDLSDVSFSVEKGESFGYLNPNGAGKTTTMNLFLSLLSPDASRALVNGPDLASDAVGRAWIHSHRARMSSLPECHGGKYLVDSCILMYMAVHTPATTTIRISRETKEILDSLKHHPKESYDTLISRLATMAHDDEPFSAEEIEDMRASLADIEAGRVKTLEAVRRELGI